jgi:hypothetical protein
LPLHRVDRGSLELEEKIKAYEHMLADLRAFHRHIIDGGLAIKLALNSQLPVLRRSCGISNALDVIGAHPPSKNVRDTV